MIISPGRGYVFVHIPKTGGTSLALALEARAMKDDILIGDDFTHGRIQFVDAFLAKASRFGTGFGLWPGVSSQ
jgi:hypothetical protein